MVPARLHSPPPGSMTLTLFLGPILLQPTPRRRLLPTTCHLPCLPTTRSECKTTVLRRQAHLVLLNRSLGPLQTNLARSRYPLHLLKTRTSLRPGGPASHNPTSSRAAASQMSSPRPRGNRVNRSKLNSHIFRRRCSKLLMRRNHPHVKLLLLNNNSLFNLSSSHRSTDNHFSRNINNHLRRCSNHNSSSSNRCTERIHSRIWPGYFNLTVGGLSGSSIHSVTHLSFPHFR